jgi:hypothetical protein
MDAAEDLHQGAFARAILAHDRVNFAGSKLKLDAVKGQRAGELLYDTRGLQ